jgi:magnesium transporter
MSQTASSLRLPLAPTAMQHRFEHNGLTWLDIMYPTTEQLGHLREQYQFHPLHLEDLVARLQRPKIDDDVEQEYTFLVLHFPIFNAMIRLPEVSEVDIFIGRDFIVTSHDGRLHAMMRLVQSATEEKHRDRLMGRGSGFLLYQILETLINTTFPMVYRLDAKVDELDADIFEQDTRRSAEEISYLRRDIISLRRIIKPNLPVVNSLANRERHFLQVDEDIYFGNLVDSLARMWDMLEEIKELIEGLDATLYNLVSYRLNQEMKVFTSVSVIFLPLTLIASILGMNVVIPFSNHPWALLLIIVLMIALAAIMVAFFRRRKIF